MQMQEAEKPWVIVVEDDDELRTQILVPGLEAGGFNVVGVGNAAQMYRSMLGQEFALFVLDVGLPDEDGFTAVTHLRGLTRAGVVLLTGRTTAADTVRGLETGADAYLTKPVDINVLIATLRALVRRQAGSGIGPAASPPVVLRADGWEIDLGGWQLLAPNQSSVKLSVAERHLLSVLLETPGEPVARRKILAHLSDNIRDFEPERLEMLVFRLRRKAAAVADESELPLRTVRGVGYLLVA